MDSGIRIHGKATENFGHLPSYPYFPIRCLLLRWPVIRSYAQQVRPSGICSPEHSSCFAFCQFLL